MELGFYFSAGFLAFLGFIAAAPLFALRGKRSWPKALFALALF